MISSPCKQPLGIWEAVAKKGTVPLPLCEKLEFRGRLKGIFPFFATASKVADFPGR
jgi:hypothetical protein